MYNIDILATVLYSVLCPFIVGCVRWALLDKGKIEFINAIFFHSNNSQ